MELTFDDLQFNYNFTCYDIQGGMNMIKEEAVLQAKHIGMHISGHHVKSYSFMQLTESEIAGICGCNNNGCEQVDSQNSLLINCKTNQCMYKVLYK